MSSNITDTQTIENTIFFRSGREREREREIDFKNYIIKLFSVKYNCNITLFATAFWTIYINTIKYSMTHSPNLDHNV